jgi:hypothetical protein
MQTTCECWPLPHVDGQDCRTDLDTTRLAMGAALIEERGLELDPDRWARRRAWLASAVFVVVVMASACLTIGVVTYAARAVAGALYGITP